MSRILIIEDEEAIADLEKDIWSFRVLRWRSRTVVIRGLYVP